jgi:hypothetical protein
VTVVGQPDGAGRITAVATERWLAGAARRRAGYAIAATKSRGAVRKLSGAGLVPVDSALGRHLKPELTLGFPETHQWIAYAMGHLDLLSRAEVYETIRSRLSS